MTKLPKARTHTNPYATHRLCCRSAVLEKGQEKQNGDGLITADVSGTAEEAPLSSYMAEGDRHLPARPLL